MTSPVAAPLSDDEADTLFLPLRDYQKIYLAVSGGVDSSALLHLVAGWFRRATGPERRIMVLTIDHQLRPESAGEAAEVARQATRLGFAHETLLWSGPKPLTGLQEAARNARYRMLLDRIASDAANAAPSGRVTCALVTAHTADDQAETFLMRLQRGSGVEGLAAIRPVSMIACRGAQGDPHRVALHRPLLSVERRRLMATLAAAGIGYSDDPSNHNPRFERVRVRQALALMHDLGFTPAGLGRTVRRLQSAQDALEALTDRLLAAGVTPMLGCTFDVDLDTILREPEEIGIRLLRRVLERAGGAARRAELTAIEAAYRRLANSGEHPIGELGFTLGGAIIEPWRERGTGGRRAWVYREPDRAGGPDIARLSPGDDLIWDNRFRVSVDKSYPEPVEVGPLRGEWPLLLSEHPCLASLTIPVGAIRALPVFRVAGRIVAASTLAEFARAQEVWATAASLVGPTRLDAGRTIPLFAAHALNLEPAGSVDFIS